MYEICSAIKKKELLLFVSQHKYAFTTMLYILLSRHHSHIPPWKARVLNCDILWAGGGYGCCKEGDTGHGEATLGHTAVHRGLMGLVIPDINHVINLVIPNTNVPSERHVPSEKCGLRGGDLVWGQSQVCSF